MFSCHLKWISYFGAMTPLDSLVCRTYWQTYWMIFPSGSAYRAFHWLIEAAPSIIAKQNSYFGYCSMDQSRYPLSPKKFWGHLGLGPIWPLYSTEGLVDSTEWVRARLVRSVVDLGADWTCPVSSGTIKTPKLINSYMGYYFGRVCLVIGLWINWTKRTKQILCDIKLI